jgi:glycerol kinase
VAVLAIDQGTSATKAVVLADGDVVALGEVPIDVVAGADGSVELDPEQLWDSILSAAGAALTEAGNPRLHAIGLANQGETVLAWDRTTGRSCGRAIVWQDRRSSTVCDRLAPYATELADVTGLELDPYFVAPKIGWLREQIGGDVTITTTDVWLLHRMCGAFVTDVATAGRSLLLDLDSGAWSERAVELFGLDVGSCRPWSATPNRSATARCSADRRRSRAHASTSRRRCSPSAAAPPARRSARTARAPSCWRAPATGRPDRRTGSSAARHGGSTTS